jgi:hypothetical protein
LIFALLRLGLHSLCRPVPAASQAQPRQLSNTVVAALVSGFWLLVLAMMQMQGLQQAVAVDTTVGGSRTCRPDSAVESPLAKAVVAIPSCAPCAGETETVAVPTTPSASPCVCPEPAVCPSPAVVAEPVGDCDAISTLREENRYIVYALHVPESRDLVAMNRYLMTIRARHSESLIFYPDWKLRLYLDGNFHDDFRKLIEAVGFEVVMLPTMADMPQFERSAQRLHVIDDETVDRFISRDLDSTLGYRDLQSTWRWIESGKAAVMQHDHKAHWNGIMAGMWGGRRKQVRALLGRSMQELLDEYRADIAHRKSLVYDNDQGFNDKMILPLLKGHSVHFDSAQAFCKHAEPDCFPFPTWPAVDDGRHMGKRAYWDNKPLIELPSMTFVDCKGWANELQAITVFATPELQGKWPAAFATMRAHC